MPDETDRSTSSETVESARDELTALLPAWTAACTFLLLCVTWPLWFRTPTTTFPQTPLFVALIEAPQVIDLSLSALLGVGLVLAAASLKLPEVHRAAMLLCCVLAVMLVSLDQQRLQPWIYHAGLVFFAAGTCRTPKAMQLCRFLVVSIYVYSAIGKLDFEFLHSVGPSFVDVLLSWIGLGLNSFSASNQLYITLALPLAELLLAVLLAVPYTRRIGAWLACTFHLVLALVFSPLGLNHSWSVIVWNLQFAVQALLLFQTNPPMPGSVGKSSRARQLSMTYYPATCVFALAILLPMGERFGKWDHWLSWALYAPHSSRAEVFVATSAVARLPESLQQLVRDPALEEPQVTTLWLRVPVKQWCLASSFTPVYPQDRSGVAAAWEIRRLLDTDFEVKVRTLSIANRFSGKRTVRDFVRPQEFRQLGDLFWINTLPRKSSGTQGAAQ